MVSFREKYFPPPHTPLPHIYIPPLHDSSTHPPHIYVPTYLSMDVYLYIYKLIKIISHLWSISWKIILSSSLTIEHSNIDLILYLSLFLNFLTKTMSVFHLTSESLNFWKSELNWTELQQLIGVKEKERYQALTHGQ